MFSVLKTAVGGADIKLLIYFLAIVLSNVFMLVAISKSCEAYSVKRRGLWMVFGFISPILCLIVYFIVLNTKYKTEPRYCMNCSQEIEGKSFTCPHCGSSNISVKRIDNFKAVRNASICFAVISILFYCSTLGVSAMVDLSEFGIEDTISAVDSAKAKKDSFNHKSYHPNNTDDMNFYFDREKRPYIDGLEVVYYTEDGEKYIFLMEKGEKGLCSITDESEFHKSEECFVDENGYLVFDKDLYSVMDDYTYCAEKDGKKYYLAAMISWDNDGNMFYNDGTTLL